MHTIHFSHENIPINNVTIGNLRNGTGDVVKYKKPHDFFVHCTKCLHTERLLQDVPFELLSEFHNCYHGIDMVVINIKCVLAMPLRKESCGCLIDNSMQKS